MPTPMVASTTTPTTVRTTITRRGRLGRETVGTGCSQHGEGRVTVQVRHPPRLRALPGLEAGGARSLVCQRLTRRAVAAGVADRVDERGAAVQTGAQALPLLIGEPGGDLSRVVVAPPPVHLLDRRQERPQPIVLDRHQPQPVPIVGSGGAGDGCLRGLDQLRRWLLVVQ